MKKNISLLTLSLFFAAAMFNGVYAKNLRAFADRVSAQYRTGKIDPHVEKTPENIVTAVQRDPEKNLPLLVNYLKEGAKNDYVFVKRIHDWITDNIAYNDALLEGIGPGTRKPYDFLRYSTTTCTGYSRLFKEMARLGGVEAIVIRGMSKNYLNKKRNPGNHSWNGVKIRNKWYLVDTTHDGRFHYKKGRFTKKKKYNDDFLFVNPELKLQINYPYKPEHFFVKSPMTREDFWKLPRFKRCKYRFDIDFLNLDRYRKSDGKRVGKIVKLYDAFFTGEGYVDLAIKHDKNVVLQFALRDSNGRNYRDNGFMYFKDNISHCRFSTPGRGVYHGSIYAKNLNKDEKFCKYETRTRDPLRDRQVL